MKLLTTKDFIERLQRMDPAGDHVLIFEAEGDCGEILASGELYPEDLDITLKFKQATCEGDVDVLRVTLKMDCYECGEAINYTIKGDNELDWDVSGGAFKIVLMDSDQREEKTK